MYDATEVGNRWLCSMILGLDVLPLTKARTPIPKYLAKALKLPRGTMFVQAHKWAKAEIGRQIEAGTFDAELLRPAHRMWTGSKG